MDVSVILSFQNYTGELTDGEIIRKETEVGVLAEELGFDRLWCTEHHFNWYSMSPDPLQTLAYVAARTSRIKLGTAALILPWNDPVRVVEKLFHLDHLSNGRLLVGLGRGLARREYEGFGIPMDDASERFWEAVPMVVDGLRTGYVESDGPHYPQTRVQIRPGPDPDHSWDGRLYGAAMSQESVPVVAKLGLRMMTFVQYDIEQHLPLINTYRQIYREEHGEEPPPVHLQDFTFCHEDEEEAERMSREYVGRWFTSIMQHYEFAGQHFGETKSYESYQAAADMIREAGLEAAAEGYVNAQATGTPKQILEEYERRVDLVGDFTASIDPSFGSLPYDKVRESLTTFSEKVLPELKKMGT